ncbi:MAG: PD40 domain-containing protein [Acidobacteria bacterium]|nr:PD40 domain-containing protein [Acidobacteriota bacterium]
MTRSALLAVHPSVGSEGLIYSSLERHGYTLFHPSAFGQGLVYEKDFKTVGTLPNGSKVNAGDLREPALGPHSFVAIREIDGVSIVMENVREIFRRTTVVHDPAMSADGGRVAFAEWVNGRYRIAEWNRSSRAIRPLLEGPADYRHPAYDPTGEWLAFATNELGNWDVGRISLSDGRREILTASKANDLMPAFSLDGKTIYFASDRRRGYRFTAIYAIALSR